MCCFKGCQNSVVNTPSTTKSPVITVSSTKPTENTGTSKCDGVCKGSYPYGCNPSFDFGYCNPSGGCHYQQTNDPNMCCFKGCSGSSQVTSSTKNPTTTKSPSNGQKCDSHCKGAYPYGCNPSFDIAYCNPTGGCHYQQTSDPTMCCFKGC